MNITRIESIEETYNTNDFPKDKNSIAIIIERLRQQLLDLTGRNRLLNFQYPKLKSLRFVEADLNWPFETLLKGETLGLKYVPLPTLHEENQISASEHAAKLGITTLYELPNSSTPSKHLQTLLYPKDLDCTLRKLSSETRLARDEAGNHILFLAGGFLQFPVTETKNASTSYTAPLLFLPVNLKKGKIDTSSGMYSYELEYFDDGEDGIRENKTLREKLADFEFCLPAYDLKQSPSEYLSIVAKACEQRKGWKVLSNLTLALLSFKKIALWADLDVKKNQKILEHSLLKKIVGLEDQQIVAESYAEEYDIDVHPMAELPFIYDVDSSQHSAIIDALEGKNLVIEGPPGTGKSQTITNLIAMAINCGKKVLFIADKKAALDVVFKRLDKAGLGSFCLELHSNKSCKKEILKSIQDRIEKNFRAPSSNDNLFVLQNLRKKLNSYTELMKLPCGLPCNASIHDVIWNIELTGEFLGEHLQQVRNLVWDEASQWTVETLRSKKQILRQIEIFYNEIKTYSEHPWRGFVPKRLTPADRDSIEQCVRELDKQIDKLIEIKSSFDNLIPDADLKNFNWDLTNNLIATLPTPVNLDKGFYTKWLHIIANREDRIAFLTGLLKNIQDFESFKSVLNKTQLQKYPDFEMMSEIPNHLMEWTVERISKCRNLLRILVCKKEYLLATCTLNSFQKTLVWFQPIESHSILKLSARELEVLIKRLESITQAVSIISAPTSLSMLRNESSWDISQIEEFIISAENLIDQARLRMDRIAPISRALALPESFETLPLLKACCEIITRIPKKVFLLKSISFRNDPEINYRAQEAEAEQQYLLKERDELGLIFHLEKLPSFEALENASKIISNLSWWSSIHASARAAKQLCKELYIRSSDYNEMNSSLERLLKWMYRKDKYLGNTRFKSAFGNAFQGLGTDWHSIQDGLEWVEFSRGKLDIFPLGINLDPVSWSESIVRQLTANQAIITEIYNYYGEIEKVAKKLLPLLIELQNLYKVGVTIAATNIPLFEVIEILKIKPACDEILNEFTSNGESGPILTWQKYLEHTQVHFNQLEQVLSKVEDLGTTSLTPQAIVKAIDAKNRIEPLYKNLSPYLSPEVLTNEMDDSIQSLKFTVQWHLQLMKSELPGEIEKHLVNFSENLGRLQFLFEKGQTLCQQWIEQTDKLSEMGDVLKSSWGLKNDNSINFDCLEKVRSKVTTALFNIDQLQSWTAYHESKQEAKALKLMELIKLIESEELPIHKLIKAFEHVYYRSCARDIYAKYPLLHRITGVTLSKAREQFAILDRDNISQNRKKIAKEIAKQHIPEGKRGLHVKELTDLELLKHEFQKKQSHIPIRQLMNRASQAILALKPCFLMSPLSVAQYLENNKFVFDLLIIDEASQMRLAESLGAILRAKQLIVVGDSKQLPPTSFFDQNMDGGADDNELSTAEEADSILDRCLQVYKKPRSLRWHYRSQHENLIAFSNYHFYGNRLVVLPSARVATGKKAIQLHYQENLYVDQCNRDEAQRLVEGVVTQLLEEPEVTVGIVALNQKQRDYIVELYEQKLKERPEFAKIHNNLEEQGNPVFIKNLENVQGDERDVIFISTVYGKAAHGANVKQTFGPINQVHGWRRLNVLFTRAKKRIALYTSLRPTDLSEESSRGVKILREYLQFAENGTLLPLEESKKEEESPFEEAVAKFLERNGFEAQFQHGVQGYSIDIVVLNPDNPREFLAAIECDGATYHSAKSVRDRDRLRQELLENLGWREKIYRIWSTDWYTNPFKEGKKLLDFLAKLRST